ncbi:protein TRANSPARENT TESTA [Musa troglodytarum]|uniref:Protein TRANSPARENT TESTA n=1 Tax=Musa troglodytarum TaxID=320322 RepID=A0A9E7GS40_9LILI|nr:protein TRANSPARENT TESTA [Musa troglodytarum]
MIGRLALYGMCVITQAYAGHVGDLELASFSIATTVVASFVFGFMLGMASALETLCGQAFGAKQYHMLGVYMQRSWVVLFVCAILLLPLYLYATPLLELVGQSREIAERAGYLSLWLLPMHFSFVFLFPLQRFLQCQLKNSVNAAFTVLALLVHVLVSWLLLEKLKLGLTVATLTLDFSWWVAVVGQFGYVVCGGCPRTWKGFSFEAFTELWGFLKLSASSGVMLCLENWYYRILVLLTGNLKNAEIAVDALSVCMNINSWEMMIPLAFFAGTGVRVANELGAGNGKGARFATIVSVATSTAVGLVFWSLIIGFHDKIALIFSTSQVIQEAVNRLCILLSFSILLNSVQPVLSGVAVGSGWQALVAYVNIGTYYIIGIPCGLILGWIFEFGVQGIWAGMIGGTGIQTLILAYLTIRCDWDKEAMIARDRVKKWSVAADNRRTNS